MAGSAIWARFTLTGPSSLWVALPSHAAAHCERGAFIVREDFPDHSFVDLVTDRLEFFAFLVHILGGMEAFGRLWDYDSAP